MPDSNGVPHNGERIAMGSGVGVPPEFYFNPTTNADHARFRIPGDKTFEPDFPVDEKIKADYPVEWAAYKEGTDQLQGQTRLEEAAWIDEATKQTLKYHRVFTVEQLASMQEGLLSQVGPGTRVLRDKAVAQVEEKTKAQLFDEAQAEKAAQQSEIDALKEQVSNLVSAQEGENALRGQIAKLGEKRGPGRPRKGLPSAG